MDIAEFNKKLGYKIAKAKGFENNNKIQKAIEEWVSISEMIIRVSKSQDLEFTYKSMLIKKTKEIIDHIKDLKSKSRGITTKSPYNEEVESNNKVQIENRELPEVKSIGEDTINNQENDKSIESSISSEKKSKVVEKSEFENIPNGFKEIKAPKDFKIITPHNKDTLSKKMNRHDDKNTRSLLKTKKDEDKTICFGCGKELSSDTKICPECGTVLKD